MSSKNHNHFTYSTKTYTKPAVLLFPSSKMSDQNPPNQNLPPQPPSGQIPLLTHQPLEFGSFLQPLAAPPPTTITPTAARDLAPGQVIFRLERPHQIIAKSKSVNPAGALTLRYGIELKLRDLWAGRRLALSETVVDTELFNVVSCEWGRYTFVCAVSFHRVPRLSIAYFALVIFSPPPAYEPTNHFPGGALLCHHSTKLTRIYSTARPRWPQQRYHHPAASARAPPYTPIRAPPFPHPGCCHRPGHWPLFQARRGGGG